jgi:hypothetical protein
MQYDDVEGVTNVCAKDGAFRHAQVSCRPGRMRPAKDAGKVNRFGLCDLDRRIQPVGEAYRDLIRTWRGQVDKGFICPS